MCLSECGLAVLLEQLNELVDGPLCGAHHGFVIFGVESAEVALDSLMEALPLEGEDMVLKARAGRH